MLEGDSCLSELRADLEATQSRPFTIRGTDFKDPAFNFQRQPALWTPTNMIHINALAQYRRWRPHHASYNSTHLEYTLEQAVIRPLGVLRVKSKSDNTLCTQ